MKENQDPLNVFNVKNVSLQNDILDIGRAKDKRKMFKLAKQMTLNEERKA